MTDTIRRQTSVYPYIVLFLLFLHLILNYVDRQILGILAGQIKAELNLTDFQLGMLGGLAFSLIYSISTIPVALFADRSNRRNIVAVAVLAWSGFTALCGLASNFVQLFLCRCGVGIGEAGGVPPSYSLISDYFPPAQRGRALGFYHMGIPVGSAIGLFVGAAIAAQYGWRTALVSVGMLGVALFPVMLLVIKEPLRGGLDDGYRPGGVAPSFGNVFAHLKARPAFWILSAGVSGAAMLMYGIAFWLPAFLQRSHGFSLGETGSLLAFATLVGGVTGTLISGWLADKLGTKNQAFYAWIPAAAHILTLPIFLVALMVSEKSYIYFLLLAPQACAVVGGAPIAIAISRLGPASMRTTILASYQFISNLVGMGMSTIILGGLSDYFAAAYQDESLRYALLYVSLVLYPLTALLLFIGGLRLKKDEYVPVAD